jgi:hypothetical protein
LSLQKCLLRFFQDNVRLSGFAGMFYEFHGEKKGPHPARHHSQRWPLLSRPGDYSCSANGAFSS